MHTAFAAIILLVSTAGPTPPTQSIDTKIKSIEKHISTFQSQVAHLCEAEVGKFYDWDREIANDYKIDLGRRNLTVYVAADGATLVRSDLLRHKAIEQLANKIAERRLQVAELKGRTPPELDPWQFDIGSVGKFPSEIARLCGSDEKHPSTCKYPMTIAVLEIVDEEDIVVAATVSEGDETLEMPFRMIGISANNLSEGGELTSVPNTLFYVTGRKSLATDDGDVSLFVVTPFEKLEELSTNHVAKNETSSPPRSVAKTKKPAKSKKKSSQRSWYPTFKSTGGRCTAITQKGTQCKRKARRGGRCWQHGG